MPMVTPSSELDDSIELPLIGPSGASVGSEWVVPPSSPLADRWVREAVGAGSELCQLRQTKTTSMPTSVVAQRTSSRAKNSCHL